MFLCFSSIFPSPLLSSPSPLLPHSLRPLHLSTPVISPFNFTYLELAADSLKYLTVHFRYALIHRWTDTVFVCMQCGDEAIVLGSTCGKKWLIIEKEAEKGGAWRSQYCKIFLISSQRLLGASNLTLVCHILDRFKFSSQGKSRCRSCQNKYLPECRWLPSRFVSFKQIFYFHLSFVPLHFTTSNDCGIRDSK